MRPNPVHQRTSRPECAHGRAPTVRQPETCECTGGESRACGADHSGGMDRGRRRTKAGHRGPTAGRIEANKPSRPPARCARGGRSHAASHMPGLAGLPAASPEAPNSRADVRRLEATGWSGHRQNCVAGYVFDRRKVPGQRRRVRPHMYRAAVILVSPSCTCTHAPPAPKCLWPGRGDEAGCTVTR